MIPIKVTPDAVMQGKSTMVGHYEPTNMLRVTISLKSPKADELRQFNAQLYDKNSPNFHNFLTPEQWASRFAPSSADEQMVMDWAKSSGLSLTARHPHRLTISFEASSEHVEQAFGVKMNHYQLGAQAFYSNDREPVMAATLAAVVESIDGLSSLAQEVPHSTGRAISNLEPQYSAGPAVAMANEGLHDGDASQVPQAIKASLAAKQNAATGVAAPSFTGSNLDPTDLYNPGAYNWEGLNNMKKCCNPFHATDSPREASVAIVTSYAIDPADITGFHNTYPYLADHWTAFNIDGTPTCPAKQTGCNFETTLDFDSVTEMANSFGAAADTAHVYLYQGVDSRTSTVIDMFSQVLTDNKTRVVTHSWGCGESSCYSDSTMRSLHNIFEAMIAQGYTILAVSSDQGATASTGSASDGSASCSTTLTVNYPASDPDVVSVGGTGLSLSSIDDTFLSETGWQGDTTKGSCSQNRGGSGGGISSFWDRPDYQADLTSRKRSVPDMALNASNGFPQNMYYGGKQSGAFGTSIATPELAGFFAQENAYLLTIGNICGSGHNQPCAPLGQPHSALYTLGKFPRFIPYSPFYDITTGCNSNDVTAANKLTAYCAGPGYDNVTGWGSINALYLAWGINAVVAGDFLAPDVTWSGIVPDVWHNTDQTATWSVQDAGHDVFHANGVAGYSQAWDDFPADLGNRTSNPSSNQPQFPNGTTGSATLAPAGQGCHHMILRVWDNGGTTALRNSPAYCYDTVPPVTQATVTGTQSGGVFSSSATVTITSSDATSGTGVIAYSLGLLLQTYTGPLVFTDPGTYRLEYYSTDKAGNTDVHHLLTVTVKMPSTTTSLSSSANPSTFGASVTLTAQVTAATGVPTGTVTFKDGATTLGATALSGGRAVFVANGLHAGSHLFRATYNGGATALSSGSNTVIQTVSQASSSTSLSSSASSVTRGKPVTLTATVTSAQRGSVVGNILFKDGSVLIATASVDPATMKATLTTATLAAGNHPITASYSGNPDNLASTSAVVTVAVNKSLASTTLASSLNPATFGQPVTLSAHVSSSSGAPATGTVLFTDGTVTLGSAVVNPATQEAVFVVTSFAAGSHALSATFAGSATDASSSATLSEKVAKAPVTITLSNTPNPSSLGRPVTFTATVTPAFGGLVSGLVDFKAGGVKFASAAVNGTTHQTSYSFAALPAGSQAITAEFEGNANLNSGSSNTVTQVVQ